MSLFNNFSKTYNWIESKFSTKKSTEQKFPIQVNNKFYNIDSNIVKNNSFIYQDTTKSIVKGMLATSIHSVKAMVAFMVPIVVASSGLQTILQSALPCMKILSNYNLNILPYQKEIVSFSENKFGKNTLSGLEFVYENITSKYLKGSLIASGIGALVGITHSVNSIESLLSTILKSSFYLTKETVNASSIVCKSVYNYFFYNAKNNENQEKLQSQEQDLYNQYDKYKIIALENQAKNIKKIITNIEEKSTDDEQSSTEEEFEIYDNLHQNTNQNNLSFNSINNDSEIYYSLNNTEEMFNINISELESIKLSGLEIDI